MKAKLKSLVVVLFFISIHLFASSDSLKESKPIVLETKTGKIRGTILVPESKTAVPVVLIISGSGPTDRDGNNSMMKNNSLKMLAEELLKNNIASVRYDKRGIAESKDDFPEPTVPTTHNNSPFLTVKFMSKRLNSLFQLKCPCSIFTATSFSWQ